MIMRRTKGQVIRKYSPWLKAEWSGREDEAEGNIRSKSKFSRAAGLSKASMAANGRSSRFCQAAVGQISLGYNAVINKGVTLGQDILCPAELNSRVDDYIPLEQVIENLKQADNFVFSSVASGHTGNTKQIRKWKPAARVSSNYTFDVLALKGNAKVGSKRGTGHTVLDTNGASAAKRSRELDDESGASKEVAQPSK
ncbi:hypothetical protein COLO4_05108 [Corchorus olitorius]|uniref:Uncharacterized protein n=1 Tax=Corchorus olitorius TaxID=93759 RepID=A0A1R3KS09_9ROSI|nr:hypothetical protein COLO4_05108 [Corchorus olitorius]